LRAFTVHRKVQVGERPHRLSGGTVSPSKNHEREAREGRDRLKRYNARQTVHATQSARRRKDNLFAALAVFVVVVLASVTQVLFFTAGPGMPVASPSATAPATVTGANIGDIPAPETSEARQWTGALTLNDVELAISIDGTAAAQGAAAFIGDVQSGYLLGKTCHRLVISASAGLIQCGSTDGVGGSDPAYSFGPIENAPASGVYPAGTIALARSAGNAYSQGHQIFIVFSDAQLPADEAGGYTVIGHVTGGLAQLQASIVAGGIAAGGASESDGAPVTETIITNATIQ
jgi:peptidyl-prolyl cis-trans isomerase B (cyclophilin B)